MNMTDIQFDTLSKLDDYAAEAGGYVVQETLEQAETTKKLIAHVRRTGNPLTQAEYNAILGQN